MTTPLTRRRFVQSAGAIVALFTFATQPLQAQGSAPLPLSLRTNRRLSGWIRIEPDNTVTVFTGKAELGQGILTALAQVAAEELDMPVSRLHVLSADTTRSPDEGYTYGSQSLEQSGTALRLAAAEARWRLTRVAASRFDVAQDALHVEQGVVIAPDGRHATFWSLVSGSEDILALDIVGNIAPKPAREHRVVGTSVQRLDLPAKVSGDAAFIQDLRFPGMLHGRTVRPRHYRARLLSVDDAKVRALPGVVAVVRHGSFLGVIAQREEQAVAARAALLEVAVWADGPALPEAGTLAASLKTWPAETTVVGQAGQETPPPLSGRRLEASYSRPYLSQASLAPSCGVAWQRDSHLTVWSHTQGTFPLRGEIAKVFALAPDKVDVVHTPSAGCYGQNGADDAAFDAAVLARAVDGRPVRVQWMRDDEFSLPPFGPAMATHVEATLSADSRVVDWAYDVWSNSHAMRPGQPGGVNLLAAWQFETPFVQSPPLRIPQPYGDGDRNAVPFYAFPRFKTTNHLLLATPVRNGSLRTLGNHLNVFSTESFVDELAALAQADPAAFRLAHLTDARARAVIQAVVAKTGWSAKAQSRRGDGTTGRGIAFARYKNIGAYAAIVVDLTVDQASGDIRVTHVTAAIDAGQIVNPDGLINQIEGGIVQALGWTLKESVRFDEHAVITRDWSSYQVMRFPDIPRVDVVLIDHPELPFAGGGEASSGPTSAAIANAFANATGRRLRDLPMTPDKVRAVLATPDAN